MIKKKNEKIRALKNEIKTLKETSAGSFDSVASRSTGSSRSPDIMINFAELDSLSSITSDSDASSENSIIAIIADGPFQDGNGESFASQFDGEYTVEYPRTESPLDLSEFRNAEAQTVNNFSANENDLHDRDENAENESNTTAEASEDREMRSFTRRPTKRRLPPTPISSTSDDDDDDNNNELEEHPSLPSSKRCWRLQSEEDDTQFEVIGEGDSSNSMEAGPSSKSASVEEPKRDKSSSSTKWRFRSKTQKHAKEENSRKTASGSRSAPQGGNAVFERTLALLEQYNLESDPEWLPQYASHRGDTTSESDTSSFAEEMEDSNSSSSDSEYLNGEDSNTTDLLHEYVLNYYF